MAVISPFKALRYDPQKVGNLDRVICPPYDVINHQDYQFYLEQSEYNVIRLELPKGNNPYKQSQILLNDWKKAQILKYDSFNCIYIYEQEFKIFDDVKKIKGIICRVKLEEFSKGTILPHEETLSNAKQDRLNLMKATNCNISQIYSLYNDDQNNTKITIDNLSSKPYNIEVKDKDNVIHRIWIINDKKQIQKIVNDFAKRKLYIADGHHRYETALKYHNWRCENGISTNKSPDSSIMMMLVDISDEGLVVFPTHRLIKNIENFNPKDIILKCSEFFDIKQYDNITQVKKLLDQAYNLNKKAFALYAEGKFSLMILKNLCVLDDILPNSSESIKKLDVTILHELILRKILGINDNDLKEQTKLSYTRDINQLIKLVDSKEFQGAFILNPTKVNEIKDVAASNQKMPQKSTYFYPKPITGLVINDLGV